MPAPYQVSNEVSVTLERSGRWKIHTPASIATNSQPCFPNVLARSSTSGSRGLPHETSLYSQVPMGRKPELLRSAHCFCADRRSRS